MDLISTIGSNLGAGLTIAAAFVFALTVVVFVHEYGHFQVARWCGVAVKTFSIGFGHELYGWYDKRGTRWRIAAIPLGGYVQFVDDANAASAGEDGDDKSELTDEQREGAFHTKPVWKRAAVVAAGPIYNFILAIAIFAISFMVLGYVVVDAKVAQVQPESPAATAGFMPGDVIVSINGENIEGFSELQNTVATRVGQEITFGVSRNGETVTLKATPELRELDDPIAGKILRPIIGIIASAEPLIAGVKSGSTADLAGFKSDDLIVGIDDQKVEHFSQVINIVNASVGKELSFHVIRDGSELTLTATPVLPEGKTATGGKGPTPSLGISVRHGRLKRIGPIAAIGKGMQRTSDIITTTLSYLGDVVTGRQGAEQIGGVVRIADVAGKVANNDWRRLIVLTAFISVSIGLINLFPIPVLDGGHLVFYAIEAIRGRPLSEKVQEYAFRVGLALLLMLMAFGFYNDRGILARWLTWT